VKTSSPTIAGRWRPTRKGEPCGGCGKADGFCTISPKGDVCLCRHGATSADPFKQKDGTVAYLHPIDGKGTATRERPSAPQPPKPKLSDGDLQNILKRHRSALSDRKLDVACAALGLSAEALRAYRVGYDDRADALSFPMEDGDGRVVGIRLRLCDPKAGKRQMCVVGSRNGLFVPADFDVRAAPDPFPGTDGFAPMLLVTPEGPTDAAAAWQVGFQSVGRPNSNGGADMVARLLRRCAAAGAPRDVVVVADRDASKWTPDGVPAWPGWEGSIGIAAAAVRGAARSVRVVMPPAGRKDLRAALNAAGDARGLGNLIVCAIEATPVATVQSVERQRTAVELMKRVCRLSIAGRSFADDAERDTVRAEVEAFAKSLVLSNRAPAWLARHDEHRKAG
jgi:hypothetical protein